MIELRTEIDVEAPAALVWAVLVDFERYGEWNPYIPRIGGALSVGGRLTVHTRPSGTRGRTFHPEVALVEPGVEFRWIGRLPIRGLFEGLHVFRVEPLGERRSRFVHREEFLGPVAWLHRLLRLPATRRGFLEMNEALKGRAESLLRRDGREDPFGGPAAATP